MEKIIPILSKQLKVHIDTLYRIRRGERRPTVKLALMMEKATGVKAEAWIFPERYGDPFSQVKVEKGRVIKKA